MSEINRWSVGVMKLRDDIVRSVCNLHTAPFSKMAAINFPDPISRVLCSTGWISRCQTICFGLKQSNQDISRSVRWSRGQNSKWRNKMATFGVFRANISREKPSREQRCALKG